MATFNELLRQGAERVVNYFLSTDLKGREIEDVVIERFPGTRIDVVTRIIKHVQSAIQAARDFIFGPEIDWDQDSKIPINRFMFDDRSQGNRYSYQSIVKMYNPYSQAESWFTVFVNSPTLLTKEELEKVLQEQGEELSRKYLDALDEDRKTGDYELTDYKVQMIQRGF